MLDHLQSIRPGDLDLAYDRLEAKGLHKRMARMVRSRLAGHSALVDFVGRRTGFKG